jgi:hypothetical protein
MSQAAEALARLADCFDRAAGDETVPLSQRLEFAKKANWLHILARLATTRWGRCEDLALGLTRLATSLPSDAQLSPFKLDLLLRHYDRHAQDGQQQAQTTRACLTDKQRAPAEASA